VFFGSFFEETFFSRVCKNARVFLICFILGGGGLLIVAWHVFFTLMFLCKERALGRILSSFEKCNGFFRACNALNVC
jgi:hypothetical protein